MKNPDHPDVHFRLTKEQYAFLKQQGKTEDRSVAYLCRRIIRQWIAKHPEDALAWDVNRLKQLTDDNVEDEGCFHKP